MELKVYIDFDGVLLDTDKILDLEYDGKISRRDFVMNYDWFKLMREDLIIKSAFKYIKESKYDIHLLSKISSMCEGQAKIKFLRSKGIDIDINLVPTLINKCDVVNAKGNVLIDDKITNLDKWNENVGISIFFNKDGLDIDVHGNKNDKYPLISDLSCLVNGIDIKKND